MALFTFCAPFDMLYRQSARMGGVNVGVNWPLSSMNGGTAPWLSPCERMASACAHGMHRRNLALHGTSNQPLRESTRKSIPSSRDVDSKTSPKILAPLPLPREQLCLASTVRGDCSWIVFVEILYVNRTMLLRRRWHLASRADTRRVCLVKALHPRYLINSSG